METTEQVEAMSQSATMMEFTIRFLLNFAAIFIIVRLIYYPKHKNNDFLFNYFLFNIINFLICFLLSTAKIKMGFAFGLFAIFSILRYRTVAVPVREMGYFFISVTLGIINALASMEDHMLQLYLANGIIMITTYVLDRQVSLKHENYKEIVYERIDLIHADKRTEMLGDINARTGLNVHRVEFMKIDFLKDVAYIHAFYFSDTNDSPTAGLDDDDD